MDGVSLREQQKWIQGAQSGDDEAFSRLVEAYQGSVYNLCYRMLGNAGDAEDAAQETFIRAYKAINRYDPGRKFSTWLFSIASHYCIDQYRRRRLQTVSLDLFSPSCLPGKGLTPEESVSQRERDERVRKMLDRLSPTDRAAMIMLYWNDMSYVEIAEALSLTVSAVKSRLHRARRELAEVWLTDSLPHSLRQEGTL
jgi:RNA polymerase sigma-70 factor (ECF subfamily)